MSRIIFISGGARSGKSRLAEQLAQQYGAPLGYVATGRAGDGEMAARIARHQVRRGPDWQTLEEPLDLCGVIGGHDGYFAAMLVDCVTLWLTNLLFHYENDPRGIAPEALALADVRAFSARFAGFRTPLILVSNEVGMGIVPDNRLARVFRDLAGEANELLAAAADEAYVTISGLPLKLKG
jgi:adenosylcobinamide kinase/adenosylcobinamide-phosphate guanylyltransferase